MPSLQQIGGILCTSGLLLICIWQWGHSQQISHLLDANTLEKTTNITIYDLQYRQFDAQGRLTHFLETPHMQHIPKNDQHILSHPHLIVTEPNQAPWEIHAEQGTAIAKAEIITLQHHVLINQHKENEEMTLQTEHLTYFPQEKKAYSSVDTLMTQGNTRVQSTGFVANLAENHIHLTHARGRHVPNQG